MTSIDFTLYVRSPRIDSLSGIALAIQLIRAAGPSPSPAVARAITAVHDRAVELQSELKLRGRVKPERARPLDVEFDNGWTALRDRLASWSKVLGPTYEAPRQRAEQLLATYFPSGVGFLKLSFEAQWVYSQQLLERFDEERAVADLERLAGADFVAHVGERHAALGALLGLAGEVREKEEVRSTGVAERVEALAAAIGEYARRLAGEVDTGDPASVAAFRKAVAPIDAHRARNAARSRASSSSSDAGGSGSSAPVIEAPADVDPSEPIPDVPR